MKARQRSQGWLTCQGTLTLMQQCKSLMEGAGHGSLTFSPAPLDDGGIVSLQGCLHTPSSGLASYDGSMTWPSYFRPSAGFERAGSAGVSSHNHIFSCAHGLPTHPVGTCTCMRVTSPCSQVSCHVCSHLCV